jgi:hypothetical protein
VKKDYECNLPFALNSLGNWYARYRPWHPSTITIFPFEKTVVKHVAKYAYENAFSISVSLS